ncbi:MAG: glycogen/starch/alpha-glucan phosphorylase [Planctomycetota bacterium]|nr:MAG: glycogen/starch/alpha-glucan phosphorylase [Planctomycetota bacterium]
MAKTSAADSPPKPRKRKDPLIERFKHRLTYSAGKHWEAATPYDLFLSLALAVRDTIVERMIATQTAYTQQDARRVYYLSLEYLLGRQLRNNLINLGLYESCRDSLAQLDVDLEDICEVERDAGLGNGGLGRLAACYLDSAATLQLPVYGYGLRYEYGIFQQQIEDGWQVEQPEYWLRYGSPWEIVRPDYATPVRLYGRVAESTDAQGRYRARWVDYQTVMGVPYDMPVVGYGGKTVNLLRLWSARASETFDLEAFNRGGYVDAVHQKVLSETITKVLYPADQTEAGRDLRLMQQYFFVACTLTDVLRRYERTHDTLDELPEKVSIQLNDTHPSLAIAELMRILVDERGLGWEHAWDITCRCFNYTNHTLLPEALEVWPVQALERIIPRHMHIIYEINRRFLEQVDARWPGDDQRKRRMSLIDENTPRGVRMAHLAMVGSRRVNGVAELHSRLIRERLAPDFAEMYPDRFVNVTNGVTPRRWMRACNPGLAALITQTIGEGWLTDLDRLKELAPLADDAAFRRAFREVKRENKGRFAAWLRETLGLVIAPDALFDVQVKRLHEYKRQLLNILQVIIRYQRLLREPNTDLPPRVVIFGAKAAPSYGRAKRIIKLINDVAATVNRDARIGDRLKVAFVPNYRVSVAERIIPAADLSEQISTAGMEASGTGNMKLAMNGALTIGTLDGANIEIRDAVGDENFFLFGLTAEQVAERRGRFDPQDALAACPPLADAIEAMCDGLFNAEEPGLFHPIRDWLLNEGDYYLLTADMPSYLEAQQRVDALWRDPERWTRAAILNVANMGRFSSDRSVREYARDIWDVHPAPVVTRRRRSTAKKKTSRT